jgi:hypothetical protein
MFCSHCGEKQDQEARFCNYCGKEMPSAPNAAVQEASFPPATQTQSIQQPVAAVPKSASKKPKGKYLLIAVSGMIAGAILLTAILFATGVFTFGSKSEKTIQGPGYATPEAAAKAYLIGLRDQNIDAMVSTFAVESYVDHYDLEAFVKRMQSYTGIYEMGIPNTNGYTRKLNILSRESSIELGIRRQYMTYNAPDETNDFQTTTLNDPDKIKDFVTKFEQDTKSYVFKDLVITGTLPLEDLTDTNAYDAYMSAQNQKNILYQVKAQGITSGNDVTDVAITFKADGKTWIFCPQLVRYDNKWYLSSSCGNMASILGYANSAGGIAPY